MRARASSTCPCRYVTHLTAPHGISMRDGLFITFDGFVFFPSAWEGVSVLRFAQNSGPGCQIISQRSLENHGRSFLFVENQRLFRIFISLFSESHCFSWFCPDFPAMVGKSEIWHPGRKGPKKVNFWSCRFRVLQEQLKKSTSESSS